MIPGTVSRLSFRRTASATTLDANVDCLILTSTTTIQTLNVKGPLTSRSTQQIILMNAAGGNITIGTAGNILVGVTLATNRMTRLVFDPVTAKWHVNEH